MKEAMEYVLTLPVSTVIVGIDKIAELEENIKITREFKPVDTDRLPAIEDKTKPYYKYLMFFKGLSDWPPEWQLRKQNNFFGTDGTFTPSKR